MRVNVTINIPNYAKDLQIPPLALQMLIENAIKHNIVSELKPLKIEVSVQDKWLMVTNNLQKRASTEKTSGPGINNIKMRYEYLSNQSIVIRASSDWIKTTLIAHIKRFTCKYIFIHARLFVYLTYNIAYDRLHIAVPNQNRRIFLH